MSMDGWDKDRVRRLEERIEVLEKIHAPRLPLGPKPPNEQEIRDRDQEMDAIVQDAKEKFAAQEVPPVDRSNRCMISGNPETPEHRQTDPKTGMQQDYVILCAEERAKGFVRPYRDAYMHLKCGDITTMGRALSETYARDPGFYSGTYCSTCHAHFPVGVDGEFRWYEMDGSIGPKVGT